MWKENIWRKKRYFCGGEKQWRRRKCHHGGTNNKQGKIWIFLGENYFFGENFFLGDYFWMTSFWGEFVLGEKFFG